MRARTAAIVMCALVGALAVQSVRAQAPDRAKVLRAAADALGMVRWSDIGAADTRLPGIDIVNTMELVGSGTSDMGGRLVKTDYHVALGYNPAAMRVEMTRTPDGGAAQHTIQTVRDTYAWDESEMGAGLVPGKGTATPMNAAAQERLLQLWTLPFGVVKGALFAGDKTIVSTEGGATVLTFPLSGPLAGVTVKATLDAKSLVTKVETRSDTPARATLVTETTYSDYADRAEVLTDIKTPGHIVRKQGGRTVLDIQVKTWETNDPYLVFPVPPNVKSAATR
ncbi:MAG TPA: hypothetical protein VN654_29370 [Vicinamibacterales bacterium]|jgi:hypothetical protein|nr:hypothetical protein [Vicinamibacterales bacterium]